MKISTEELIKHYGDLEVVFQSYSDFKFTFFGKECDEVTCYIEVITDKYEIPHISITNNCYTLEEILNEFSDVNLGIDIVDYDQKFTWYNF